MNRRISCKLRDRTVVESRTRKQDKTPISKTEYEREKKRCQGRQENGGVLKKRGPKVKYGMKTMTAEEKRAYERNRKQLLRLSKKMKEKELIETEEDDEEELETEEQQN